MKKIILIIIGAPFLLVALFILYLFIAPVLLSLAGYRVGNGIYFAEQTAKEILENKLSVEECNKIIYAFEIMGPSVSELRRSCDYTYAQLTHDPHVCARLMPSSYGISCIGEISGTVSKYTDCFDKRDVSGLADGELQCVTYDEKTEKSTITRTKDCTNILLPILQDQCNTMLGAHYGDTKYCDKIENPVLKSVCEVRIELQKKYPGIPELR